MSGESSARPAAPATVLLVEDNPDDRELTLAALSGLAGKIVLARDGVEAVEYLLGRPGPAPDLILLDLKLPKVDGLRVLEFLRADPRTALYRVVVLTSSDEERDRERCRRLGVSDYVLKDVDFARFLSRVRTLWPQWTGPGTAAPASPETSPAVE